MSEPILGFVTIRNFLGATTIAFAEAGVWTQVSYLPHWLLTLTTFLAIGSFLVLALESAIRSLSLKLAKILWVVHVSFVASVLYAFLGNVAPAPFSAKDLASIDYAGRDPFSLFVVAYKDSIHGPTVSPATYLMYVEIVNREAHPIRIESYSVALSRHRYVPWGYSLPPIPLTEVPVFALAPLNTRAVILPDRQFWFLEEQCF